MLTDALVGSRGHREHGVQERVLSALLTEMDGIGVQRDSLSAVCHLQVIINNAVLMDCLYKCNVVSACTLYLVAQRYDAINTGCSVPNQSILLKCYGSMVVLLLAAVYIYNTEMILK